MNRLVKISVAFISSYACLLSFLHGLFEILQGNKRTEGIFIYAISRLNQNGESWHGNFPAITIIPNYLLTGICTMLFSLMLFTYIVRNYKNRYSLFTLLFISLLILVSGGGFIPFLLLTISGLSSLFINYKLNAHQSKMINKKIYLAWVIGIVLFIICIISEWVLGYYLNDTMVKINRIFFAVKMALPIFIIAISIIYDIKHSEHDYGT